MTKQSRKRQAGFSLIELMVVVAIIGILSAIAVPNYQKFQRKARQSEARGVLSGIYTAQKAFTAEWGIPASNLPMTGFMADGDLRYIHGFDAEVAAQPTNGTNGYRGVTHIAGRLHTAGACGQPSTAAGQGMPDCVSTGFAGAVAGIAAAVPPAVAAGQLSFVAASAGDIGGTVDDVWTIDEAKALSLVTDGTL